MLSRQPASVPSGARPAPASVAQPPAAQPRQAAAAQPPIAKSPPAPAPVPPPAPVPSTRPPADFFDDIQGDDVSIDEEPPVTAVDMRAPGVYVPPPPAARIDWPAGISDDAEAEDALRRALEGKTDGRPLHALAAQVIEAASDLERAVLKREPQPFDASAVRKATVIRLRVAEALATTPAAGSPVDKAALSAILGQIDGLLAEVAPLLQGASEELAPALEAVRDSLVREAIDFSEAASKVEAVTPPTTTQPDVVRSRGARLISIDSGVPLEPRRGLAKQIALIVVLVSMAVATVAYHVTERRRSPVSPPNTFATPAGTLGLEQSGIRTLIAPPGEKPKPEQIEEFKTLEQAQGKTVREVAPGVWVSQPGGEGAKP